MPLPDKRLTVRLHEVNPDAPADGLRCDSLPLAEPRLGECLVAMLHAPINPSDINVMQGVYMLKPPELPSVIGFEGCGQVISMQDPSSSLNVGDFVISWDWGWGTFSQYITITAEKLIRVPPSIDPKVACRMGINPPTAWGLLHSAVAVAPGDWVIQNAANSAVGLALVQVARFLKINLISFVRTSDAAQIVQAAGGEHVFLEDDASAPDAVADATQGQPIGLALNCVGGASTRLLTRYLSEGGTVLTYGSMSREPIPVGGGQLIFKDLRFLGFHLFRWRKQQSKETLQAMWDTLFELAAKGAFDAPLEAEYPLTQYVEAVQHAAQPQRRGKVIFTV